MSRTGLLAVSFCLAAASIARAQSLEEKRDRKLAEAWVKQSGWISDYDEAKKKAQETGKPILAYFTRSYSP